MTKAEKNKIIKYVDSLSDEQLEIEYYRATFDSLGSQTEDMYELGYDIRDILEREEFEKYLRAYASVLENCCVKRGIKLWE